MDDKLDEKDTGWGWGDKLGKESGGGGEGTPTPIAKTAQRKMTERRPLH